MTLQLKTMEQFLETLQIEELRLEPGAKQRLLANGQKSAADLLAMKPADLAALIGEDDLPMGLGNKGYCSTPFNNYGEAAVWLIENALAPLLGWEILKQTRPGRNEMRRSSRL